MDFGQFKSVLLTGLASIVLILIGLVYNAQAENLKAATNDIVDIKLAVVELKVIVLELKKSNDRLTELLDERYDDASVARPRPRR